MVESVRRVSFITGSIIAGVGLAFEVVGIVSVGAERGGLGPAEYGRYVLVGIPLLIAGTALRKYARKAKETGDTCAS